jgi:hypothetical protein
MPPITIPAKANPIATTMVTTVNNATGVTVVESSNGFVVNGTATIIRSGSTIAETTITNINGNTLTLVNASAVIEGDTICYGVNRTPAYSSARFPADPIDSQTITAVNSAARTVSISSALSFSLGRSIIRSATNQDIAELIITAIDLTQNILTLDSVTGISIGCVIFQPANELIIDPDNYQVLSIDQIAGVGPARVGSKYRNGVRFQNENPFAVTITPAVRVYL